MIEVNFMKNKTLWLVRTALLIALLIILQAVTKAGGQFVTGSCVNAVLAVAVLTCGLASGLTVALLSPFMAFLLGIGPALIYIVPAIAVGNSVFVLLLHLLCKGKLWQRAAGLGIAATAKFGALYLLGLLNVKYVCIATCITEFLILSIRAFVAYRNRHKLRDQQ